MYLTMLTTSLFQAYVIQFATNLNRSVEKDSGGRRIGPLSGWWQGKGAHSWCLHHIVSEQNKA